MVYFNNNSVNQVWLGVNIWSSLSNPNYLWKLQNSQGRDYVYFIPKNITNTIPSNYANKYQVFEFSTLRSIPQSFVASAGTDCNIYLTNENQYWLTIWEQPSNSFSLDPNQATNIVFNELAFIYKGQDEITYTGNTSLNQPNVIYYSQTFITPTNTASPTPTPPPATPTSTPSNTPSQTATRTQTPTQTKTPSQTPSHTPTQTNTPTHSSTSTPTSTETPTQTPTQTNTPTPSTTPPPIDCTWSGTTSLWVNDVLLWSDCDRVPEPTPTSTPSPTPTIPVTPSMTPTNTSTPTMTPTNTETPTNTPTNTLTPTPSVSPVPVLSFLVSSGSTQEVACGIGPYFYVYAEDLGNCAGCLPSTCWACLTTSQQVYSDPLLTIPVGTGYYMNETQSGGPFQTWYIVGGFPQGAGFTSCPFGPTPSPTATITQTPTNTQTPSGTNTFCSTYVMDPEPQASWSYNRCDGTLIQRFGETSTYTECVRNGTLNILSGTLIITDLGQCI